MACRRFFQFQRKVFRHLSWKKDISNVFFFGTPESSKAQNMAGILPCKNRHSWVEENSDVFTASKCWEGGFTQLLGRKRRR